METDVWWLVVVCSVLAPLAVLLMVIVVVAWHRSGRGPATPSPDGRGPAQLWSHTALERLMFELETETDKMTILCALQLRAGERVDDRLRVELGRLRVH